MGRFLVVTPDLPFPPRNGVTVPPAALASGLRARGHRVEVAWLRASQGGDGSDSPDAEAETRDAVDALHVVPVRIRSGIGRALGHLLTGRASFDRFAPAWSGAPPVDPTTQPDLIWATPRNSLGLVATLRHQAGWDRVPWVAAVNDIWTGVVARRGDEGRARAPSWSDRLERTLLRRAEARLLGQAGRVAVQSESDRRVAVDELGLDPGAVQIVANGVDEGLFGLDLTRPRSAVGWVGDARGAHYRSSAARLLGEVWPEVAAADPTRRLRLSGPGTDALDVTSSSVDVTGFLPDIREVYRPMQLLVAPVFKGYGRINKVAEAMAAGVPVLGDSTAFHGLPDFRAGVHGVVVDRWPEMAGVLGDLLDDPHRLQALAQAGRTLARRHFRWSHRVDVVESWLEASAEEAR